MQKVPRMGLNRFLRVRNALVFVRRIILTRFWGLDIHGTAELSLSCRLDLTFPAGVHVGEYSYLAFESCVLTHDRTRGLYLHTTIGSNCFIGARSIILPGVVVGDGSVVGAGSVVTRSVPSGSLVAGNPARVLKRDIGVGRYGRFEHADSTEDKLVREGNLLTGS